MKREFSNISLCDRTSFGVKINAKTLCEWETIEDLKSIFSPQVPEAWMNLSGGNNLLFCSDYSGVLVTPICKSIDIVNETQDEIDVRAEAGVEWDDLVEWAVQRELWGIENLSLIPGKCGAAPVQNIGAYGVELKDVIVNVETFSPATQNVAILDGAHCGFGYRDSIFKGALKGKVVVTAITIRLSKKAKPQLGYKDIIAELAKRGEPTLRNIRDSICHIREAKLPNIKEFGNAGSFFKNPIVKIEKAEELKAKYPDMPSYPADEQHVKLAAGWLIEKAGMKGYQKGHAAVHQNQALVLINLGGATGQEIIELAKEVQEKVRDVFGVEIEAEVNIIE